jgi:hypothetical protein
VRKSALVCLVSAMTVFVVALHGLQAQELTPKRQVTRKVPSKAFVAPKYTVKILFVRLADDDGSKASTLTKANAQAALDTANTIFHADGGDVGFEMAPESDFSGYVRNTTMNHDCLLQPGWTEAKIASQTNADVNGDGTVDGADTGVMGNGTPVVAARNAYAVLRPNRLVVYSRGSSEYVTWDQTHYVLKYATGGHSGGNLFYVAMPGTFGGGTLLGHETGHYFHLPHTFGRSSYVPSSMSDAVAIVQTWVQAHPSGSPLACFDGDRRDVPAILDTPPDAGGSIFTELYGDVCDPNKGSVPFVVSVGGHQKTLQLTPDRANIMSYFKSCPWPMRFSRNQYTIMDDSLATGNRTPLTVGDPYESPCYQALHPERDSQNDALGSLRNVLRRAANCHLLTKRPWRWEMVTDIYSTPERATRVMVRDQANAQLFVDLSRERQLLSVLSDGRSIIFEDER